MKLFVLGLFSATFSAVTEVSRSRRATKVAYSLNGNENPDTLMNILVELAGKNF